MEKEYDIIKITENDIDELRIPINPEKDLLIVIQTDNNGISD